MQNQLEESLRSSFRVAESEKGIVAKCIATENCPYKATKVKTAAGSLYFSCSNLTQHLKRKHADEHTDVLAKRQKLNNKSDQPTISGFLNVKEKCLKKDDEKEITIRVSVEAMKKYAVEAVTVNGLPLHTFEKSGIRNLLFPVVNQLQLTLNSENIRDFVLDHAKILRSEIANKIKNKLVCLKFDIGSRKERGFLGINVQYILKGKLEVHTLTVLELLEKHTGEVLKSCVEDVLTEYGVDLEQIYANTTDNGTNMIKCGKLMDSDVKESLCLEEDMEEGCEEGLEEDDDHSGDLLTKVTESVGKISSGVAITRCGTHSLELDIDSTLAEIEPGKCMLSKVRKTIRKLQTQKLKPQLDAKKLPKPILDKNPRTTSEMISQFLLLRPSLGEMNLPQQLTFSGRIINIIFISLLNNAMRWQNKGN